MNRLRVFSLLRFLLAGLALCLLLGVFVQDLRPAAASSGPIRVLYLFAPSSPDQVARLVQFERRALSAGNVDVIGLSRDMSVPDGIHAMPAARFVRSATEEVASRRWVMDRLQERGDALRIERPEATYSSDRSRSIEMTAAVAGFSLVATDIDFSTWGKVKDLFR